MFSINKFEKIIYWFTVNACKTILSNNTNQNTEHNISWIYNFFIFSKVYFHPVFHQNKTTFFYLFTRLENRFFIFLTKYILNLELIFNIFQILLIHTFHSYCHYFQNYSTRQYIIWLQKINNKKLFNFFLKNFYKKYLNFCFFKLLCFLTLFQVYEFFFFIILFYL